MDEQNGDVLPTTNINHTAHDERDYVRIDIEPIENYLNFSDLHAINSNEYQQATT